MVKYNDTFKMDVDSSVVSTARVGYVDSAVDTRFSTTGVKRIYMNVTSIRWNAGSFMQVPEVPRPDVSTLSTDLSYGDFIGVPNPTYTIQGVIKLSDYTINSNYPSPLITYNDGTEKEAYQVSVKLLQQMWKSGHLFQITDYYDFDESSDTIPVYRVSSLGVGDVVSKPTVRVTSLTFSTNTSISEGDKIVYNLVCKEVKNG